MSATLATRLRRLLDVLQQCHGVKRSVAARIVAAHFGCAVSTIQQLARNARVVSPDTVSVYSDGLRSLELRFHRPLKALKAYEDTVAEYACARDIERAA